MLYNVYVIDVTYYVYWVMVENVLKFLDISFASQHFVTRIWKIIFYRGINGISDGLTTSNTNNWTLKSLVVLSELGKLLEKKYLRYIYSYLLKKLLRYTWKYSPSAPEWLLFYNHKTGHNYFLKHIDFIHIRVMYV